MEHKFETNILDEFQFYNYVLSDEEKVETLNFFSDKRSEIRELIDRLSWNETEYEQKKAIESLCLNLYPCEYIYLVMPDRYTINTINGKITYCKQHTGKSRWENAAKAIVSLGWPKVDHIIIPLFIWLLDPNWPGSELIYNFISLLPYDVLCNKTNQIINSPERYRPCDYEELIQIIEELKEDRKTD